MSATNAPWSLSFTCDPSAAPAVMKAIVSATLLVSLILGSQALACSCASSRDSQEQQIARAFSAARSVVVARIVTVTQSPYPGDQAGRLLIESVTFEITVADAAASLPKP